HAGTAEDPYSVADVLKYISNLGPATSSEDVYVKGIISSIYEVSTSFGNATYFIKDEGIENEVKVFRGLYLDGAKFTSADQIGVGDKVVVVGKVLDYDGTPEVNSGNKIVSIIKAPYLKATASKETGIAAAGETVTITVDTNVDSWTATSNNAAFVVGTPSDNTVDVDVSKNTDATERTATITVTAGTLSKTITLTQRGAADVIETIDFESASTDYTFWTFTNMTSQQTGSITAKGGTNYGTTGGKTTASITTKNAIAKPKSITFYVSKQTNNTTSSSWKIQVSSDNKTWTDVKTQSATSMSKGSWVEVTQDLSSYSNVYVRVYYDGTSAVRNIDDLSLTYSNRLPSVGGDGVKSPRQM
ncbi:MAG: BACON domain-containing protein, partial [Candidatus Cryptobacteroides sp.]